MIHLIAFGLAHREEGIRAFWKGNGTNVIRIFPYSAVQFSTNDHLKRLLATKVYFQDHHPRGAQDVCGDKVLKPGPLHGRMESCW